MTFSNVYGCYITFSNIAYFSFESDDAYGTNKYRQMGIFFIKKTQDIELKFLKLINSLEL